MATDILNDLGTIEDARHDNQHVVAEQMGELGRLELGSLT
jgi:hypothetical protein